MSRIGNNEPTKKEKKLRLLLEQMLDDATADSYNPNKRVWAIRSTLYREIANEIGYEYDPARAMERQ